MINIEKQWDNYFELGKQVIENEISEEALKKEINAFSFFLSELNQDYYYNATYLSNYVMEFLRFLKYFYRKYMFVKQLFKVTSRYQKVSLVKRSREDMEKKEIYDMVIQELIEKALSVRRETFSSDEKQFYETLKEKSERTRGVL